MFFRLLVLGLVLVYVFLWGDYIKMLIFLEVLRLVFIRVLILGIKIDFFSLNFFLGV